MIVDSDFVDVDASDWYEACSRAHRDGFTTADWLTAVDRVDHLQVLIHLVHPGDHRDMLIRTGIRLDDLRIPSVATLFPGSDWHERETAEMFGVTFEGRPATAPLLLRTHPDIPPLRKASPLPERVDTPWPGADNASRRRRKLAPGVREEWVESHE